MKRTMRCKAKAVPESHELGFANTGTEQVGFRVTIIDGELAGQSVSWYGYFTDASELRTIEALKTAGWDGTDFANLPGLGSTEFELTLEEEEDQDDAGNVSVYWKPQYINRIGVAMRNKMDETQKRQFAARMERLAGGPRQTAARPAQRPAQQRPAQRTAPATNGGTRLPPQFAEDPPYSDDDIPL